MVVNKKTYTNLINFFLENNIKIEKSDMAFSVAGRDSDREDWGKGNKGSWSKKKKLFSIKWIKM